MVLNGVKADHKNSPYGFISISMVSIALIVFCLHVLAQIETKSMRKTLQISRYLRAALWKPAHIWVRKIKGESVP